VACKDVDLAQPANSSAALPSLRPSLQATAAPAAARMGAGACTGKACMAVPEAACMVQGPWVSRVYYFRVASQTAVGMLGHASNSLPHRCCAAAVGAGPFDPNDPNAPPQPPSAWQAMLHAVSGGCTGIVVLPASVQFWCRGMPLTACIFKPCLPSRLIRLPACLPACRGGALLWPPVLSSR
jgi:hypothetical protein